MFEIIVTLARKTNKQTKIEGENANADRETHTHSKRNRHGPVSGGKRGRERGRKKKERNEVE